MGKIATKAKTLIKNVAYDVKNHWRVPKKGEYIPYREVVAYTIGVTGNDATNYIEEIVQFSASAFLVGAIMGISYTDIAIIGIITQIMSFALVFMQPFNILIFENHGRLERKTLIAMHSLNFAQVAVGVALMFVSPVPFEALIKGLPQIIACELFGNVIFFYFNYIIRRLFSAKYGRYKPQLIALGWPTALIFLAIVYLPYDTMDYTTLLVVISFLFTCLNRFLNTYQTHSDDIINVMTPNSDERQKFLSIIPIVTGILGSVYRIGFPIVAQATGGLLNIMSYRVFIPLLTLFSILVGLFILPCKERVIEDVENRPKVEFWRGAKKVLRSKNIWMIQLANYIGYFNNTAQKVLDYYIIYTTRMEWLSGVIVFISGATALVANFLSPWLVRRFEKRTIMVCCRVLWVASMGLGWLAILGQSLVGYVFVMLLKNIASTVNNGVGKSFIADQLDYYQWKNGERADSFITLFQYIFVPVTLAFSYVTPFILESQGLTSDWDVMFDSGIASNVYIAHLLINAVGLTVSTIPYFFYTFTREQHQQCIREMEERLGLVEPEKEKERVRESALDIEIY